MGILGLVSENVLGTERYKRGHGRNENQVENRLKTCEAQTIPT
jgi:hypothetical protein